METLGTNGDDVSVWEHSLDDLSTETRSTRRRLRPCTLGKPRMASARLSDLPLCATHRHQHPSRCPSGFPTRQGQVSLMCNVHGGRVRRQSRTASSVHRWHCVQHPVMGIQHNAVVRQRNTMTRTGRVTEYMEGVLHIPKGICVLCAPSPRSSLQMLGPTSGSLSAVGATRLREVLFNAEELQMCSSA